MSKMRQGSAAYNDEAIEMALSKVYILPCVDCGHPVNVGYCCGSCGGGNGTTNDDYLEIKYKALKSD